VTAGRIGRRVSLGALLLVIAAAAGLAACGGNGGGSKESAPKRWASTFCQTFGSYERAVGQLSTRFNESVQAMPAGELAARKAALVEYLSASIARTDKFLRALNGAGEPSVPDGGDFVGSITVGFRDLRSTLSDARRDAEQLSDSDPAAFSTTVGEITGLISTGSNRSREAISRARTRYETGELDRAFDRAQACESMR
jgi:hypothetical protein